LERKARFPAFYAGNAPELLKNRNYSAGCGRAGWKIENEHTKALKNHGYNLEHNFGHGEKHGSENFCLMNLPAFLFHTLLFLGDERYRGARNRSGRQDNFLARRGTSSVVFSMKTGPLLSFSSGEMNPMGDTLNS
jgi:hypothetical protein